MSSNENLTKMSTYEISKSSLLSLKAEILKKQEELQKSKIHNKAKLQTQYKKPLELKNKGVQSCAANDDDDIDEDLLKKSRSALEEKTKLYNKLSQGSKNEIEETYNRKYLVHFDQKAQNEQFIDKAEKIDDDGDLSDEEWVEFVDSFGRTRTCLKKDLDSFKEKDRICPRTDVPDDNEKQNSPENNFNNTSEMLSCDMRRELLRREWEQQEDKLKDKADVHYQDILFGEARTHGVSYYGFSKDEFTRNKEQEALNQLRKDTETQQNLAQEIRKNREKQLAARVRAATNRKRAREGLPPLTSDGEQMEQKLVSIIDCPVDVKTVTSVENEVDKNEIKRQNHIRPWDVGKEGVKSPLKNARIHSGIREPYDQHEWNEIQRSKRVNEFAPPGTYHSSNPGCVNPYKLSMTPVPIDNECSDSREDSADELLKDYDRSRAEVSPPATYDYYGPNIKRSQVSRQSTENNMEDSIMAGLKFLRQKIEQKESNK